MSDLTGCLRYRDGRFGGLILQVEYNWQGSPAGVRPGIIVTEKRWRDADWPDLLELQAKKPEPSERQRAHGFGRRVD